MIETRTPIVVIYDPAQVDAEHVVIARARIREYLKEQDVDGVIDFVAEDGHPPLLSQSNYWSRTDVGPILRQIALDIHEKRKGRIKVLQRTLMNSVWVNESDEINDWMQELGRRWRFQTLSLSVAQIEYKPNRHVKAFLTVHFSTKD